MSAWIYIAAPLSQASKCEALAAILRERGHFPVSSWHRVVTKLGLSADASDTVERKRVLDQNLRDLEAADMVVAITCDGLPRSTFFEIGYACKAGKPVVWVPAKENNPLCDAHEMITLVEPGEDVHDVIDRVACDVEDCRGVA